MAETVRFPPFTKHPDDSGQYAFIFTKAITIPDGLTITSVGTITIRVDSGTDDALTTLVVGAGAPNAATFVDDDGNTVAVGKAVLANVSGGTDGVRYLVKIPATLSNSRVIAGEAPFYMKR